MKIPRMVNMDRKRKIRVILASLAVVSLLYYMTSLRLYLFQELVTRLYYMPIILGGVWFGLRGGIQASLLVTLICLPHTWRAAKVDQALFYDEVLELFLFNLVGAVAGAWRDRERRQAALNQELQALATLGEAVSFLAHEMKNMLIPMRGFLRRIRESQASGAKLVSYLGIVEQESAKLEKMVKDMLSFGRNAPLHKEEVEVGPLVEELRQVLEVEFRDKGIRLVCRCQEGTNRTKLDREKVHHALANVLQNALHASSKGKEVRLLVQNDPGRLDIIVEDDGAGIPKELLEQVFQPFFTTKPQGTGLGLAITQRIVKQHGGDIRVESTPGVGTRIHLSFPVF
jgi:two-component system, NtrC family, sensor histidine kinase HydH